MKEYLKAAAAAIREDETLQNMGVEVFAADSTTEEKLKGSLSGGISAELKSLGFSQMNAAGTLSVFFYFGVVVKVRCNVLNEKLNRSSDVDAVSERIAALLHHNRLGEIMAIFSKCLRIHESHTITLNSRILKIEVGKNEKAALILFYSSRLPLSQIQNIVNGESSSSGGTAGIFNAGLLGGVWD